jgi:hypothetical protein
MGRAQRYPSLLLLRIEKRWVSLRSTHPTRNKNRLRQKTNFANALNVFAAFKRRRENNSLYPKTKSGVCFTHPARQEGRYGQSSPDVARDAMDAKGATTRCPMRTAKSCGPDSPMLESSLASDARGDGG